MNIATYSPVFVLLFVFALLWILMDIHIQNLTAMQKWLLPFLLLFLAVFNHVLRLQLGSAVYGKLIFLTMHLPYFLIFLYITKCGVIKMAFMIFSAVVFTSPTVFIGNFVKTILGDFSLGLLLSNIITYCVALLLAQLVFRESFNYLIKYGETRTILHFSLVPLLYYVYLFAAMNLDFSEFSSIGGLIVRTLPTVYVFVFYFLLLRSYKELNKKREMETVRAALIQQLNSAEEQIALLNETRTQTAIYQHNMRHHLNVIDGFLSSGEPKQAEEYIKKVQSDIEAITSKRFCGNEIVNLLCSSFSGKAKSLGIRLKVDARLPQKLSVSDTELCSVLSNGLENAVNAVKKLDEPNRWVEIYCEVRMNKLLIEINNPYCGEIPIRDGLPVSEKDGHGYGCQSIRAIVERHRGLCSFEPKNGVFTLRILLPE